MVMKILYILGAYKPKASANGLCSENIINRLSAEGHSVTVISNLQCETPEYTREADGTEIYRVKQRLYLRLKAFGEATQSKAIGKLASAAAFFLNKLQLLINTPSWPIISRGTVRRFKKAALAICEKESFDAVIAVYTPIEALLAGAAVKKKYPHIAFYPYFLDSLAFGYGPKYFGAEKTMARGLALEKEIFPLADKIILMKSSEEKQRKYNPEFADKFCFLDIPMLKKPCEEAVNVSKERGKTRLLFVGSISASVRNPDTLISALAGLEDENLYCEFVGNIDCPQKFAVLKKAYGERLEFTPFMPHERLTEKFREADILLNIGNLVSTMVPSKIFEYMSYGKPIISTYDIPDEPSARYLRNYPCALLLNGNDGPEKNTQKVKSFIEKSVGAQTDFDELKKKFILNTPEEFVRCVAGGEVKL